MLLVFAFLLFQVCLPMTIREYFWDAVWLFMKNLCTPVGSFKFFAYIDYRVVCAVKPFFHFTCSFSSSQSLTLHDIVIFRKCLVSMSWSDAATCRLTFLVLHNWLRSFIKHAMHDVCFLFSLFHCVKIGNLIIRYLLTLTSSWNAVFRRPVSAMNLAKLQY